jgi:GTPase KRas protein
MEIYRIMLLGSHHNTKKFMHKLFSGNEFYCDIENSFKKHFFINDKSCTLEFFDTNKVADDYFDEIKNFYKNLFKKADCYIIIYSITNRSEFYNLEIYYNQIINAKKDKNVENIPLIIIGTNYNENTERDITYNEGYLLSKKIKCKFIEMDTKTNQYLDFLFYEIIKIIKI